MDTTNSPIVSFIVAPVRERGLKLHINKIILHSSSRSREGAWIEIRTVFVSPLLTLSRSREGAWIEI